MKLPITMLSLLLAGILFQGFRTADRKVDLDPVQASDRAMEHWVDSIYNIMTLDERIGQLMMIRAHSDKGREHERQVEDLIRDYHVGGLTFFQGGVEKQASLTNRYQALSRPVPLMISMDAEHGLGWRLKKSAIAYPHALMLGAIQDDALLYQLGADIADQCRRLGVHVNFAPVVDVNNNAANPVINIRSYGEDRYNVAVKGYMYMKGLQDHHVLACAKHFPGHGDTDTDSHYDLPVIFHDWERLDSIELFPFSVLTEQGVGSVMIAHLAVPVIDSTPNLPTTLSRPAVTNLLKERYGYEGLIITDGLGMAGVTKHHRPGELEAKALVVGNDILLLPQDVPAAFAAIKRFLEEGLLSENRLKESVKKVLSAKYKLGLTRPQSVDLENLRADLNAPKYLAFKRKLIREAMTMVRNEGILVPFRKLDTLDMASLSIGVNGLSPFQQSLSKYAEMPHFQTDNRISKSDYGRLMRQLGEKEVVVVGLHDMSRYASRDYGLTQSAKAFINDLQKRTKVVLVVFGTPYALKDFDNLDWVLQAYEEDPMVQDLAAQGLFGAFSFKGRLPVTASPKSKEGTGLVTPDLFRLGYGLPEEAGMRSEVLLKIDTIVANGIDSGAMPGCVVLAARNGKVIFEKAYGYHTYDKKRPMTMEDVFDLASVTKIAAATVSFMKLEEDGVVRLEDTLGRYLPSLDTTDLSGVLIEEMMAHRAGLKAWIPFYLETLDEKKRPLKEIYRTKPDLDFAIPVTEKLFMQNVYRDTIWKRIYDSKLTSYKRYRYSDLAFYLLARIIERQGGLPIDEYTDRHFYQPMGLRSTTFNPLKRIPKDRIPPSEEDKYFRYQRIQGHVHDMGAAMLGGVSGHAGLFSSAGDLAVLMQMLLNKGYYGGTYYLKPATVDRFTTRCKSCTRRGMGFDMPQLDTLLSQNVSPMASPRTFGHLGFTGTCTWVDPESNLIYIFLSNRTYPKMSNNLLGKMDIRPRIQTVFYQAIQPEAEHESLTSTVSRR